MQINVRVFNNISSFYANYTYSVWQAITNVVNLVTVLPPFPPGVTLFDSCVPSASTLQFTALLATGALTPGKLKLKLSFVNVFILTGKCKSKLSLSIISSLRGSHSD